MKHTRLLGSIVAAVMVFYLVPLFGNKGEVGVVSVSQAGANQWHTVKTNHSYENPVVIMGPPTNQDTTPLSVRVRKVTATGFEFQLDNWDYLPAAHGEETLSYLVVEAGAYTLANGASIEAGIQTGIESNTWINQALTAEFSNSPALFAQVVTVNDPGAVTIHIHNIRPDRFSNRLLVEEAKKAAGHPAEEVAWVAIESSSLGGTRRYIAGISDRKIGHIPLPVNFGEGGFDQGSPFFSNQRSFNDTDTSAVRLTSVLPSSAIVYQQDEKSQDNEIIHAVDSLSFAVFQSAGDIPFDPNPPIAADDEISIQPFGMVNLNVLANDLDPEDDMDPATLTLDTGPSSGTVAVDPVNGTMTYTNTSVQGTSDVFTYKVSDSRGDESNVASVKVNIDSADRLPNTRYFYLDL